MMTTIAPTTGEYWPKRCGGAVFRGPGTTSGKARAWLLAALPLFVPLAAQRVLAEETPKTLRLCADPANLPFSSADPKTPGLYVEIGEAIGRAMGRPVAPVWNLTYFGKRAIRTTLLAGKCDASHRLTAGQGLHGAEKSSSPSLSSTWCQAVAPASHWKRHWECAFSLAAASSPTRRQSRWKRLGLSHAADRPDDPGRQLPCVPLPMRTPTPTTGEMTMIWTRPRFASAWSSTDTCLASSDRIKAAPRSALPSRLDV